MSFHFNWSNLDQNELSQQLIKTINELLATIPPNDQLAGPVRMTDLSFGSSAPIIELTSINVLNLLVQEFEFKFSYNGDGYAKIETMAQINKLTTRTTMASSFLDALSSQKPMVMPLKIHVHNLIISGYIRIRLTRKSVLDFDQVTLSIRLLHENPLKQIVISTNFEEDMPATKEIFDKQVQQGVAETISELMNNDKEIPIILKKEKETL